MAIDVSLVRSNVPGDGKIQPASGPTGGGDIDFAKLMRGGAIGGGRLAALSDQAGIASLVDKTGPAASRVERPRNIVDEHANSSRKDDRSPGRDAPPATKRSDDYGRDPAQPNDTGYSQSPPAPVAAVDYGRREDAPVSQQQQSAAAEATNKQSSPAEKAAPDDAGKKAVTAEKAGKQTAAGNGAAKAGSERAKAATSNAEQILSSLLAAAQAGALPGKTAEKATGPGNSGGSAASAPAKVASGPEKTLAPGDNKAAKTALNGKDGSAVKMDNKAAFNLHNGQAATAKAGGGQAANATGNVQNQAADAGVAGKDAAARQSAQLSKMVGDGARISVSVETSNQSATLVSKPVASLASNAALIGENNAGKGSAYQTPTAATAPTGQYQTNAAPLDLSQAAAQNRAAISAGLEVKDLAPTGRQAGPAGPLATAAEGGAAATAAVNTSPQAPFKALARTTGAPRFSRPGQALTDQVTVQITKALSAGADKITIQLKPADLGRVDVKLEVAHDGHLTAVVTADNRNTLNLLQRDARDLQQALQNTGLQLGNDSLSFNLREQNEREGRSQGGGDHADDGVEAIDSVGESQVTGLARNIISDTRVDIRA